MAGGGFCGSACTADRYSEKGLCPGNPVPFIVFSPMHSARYRTISFLQGCAGRYKTRR